jgi:putative FmdB family regulatory protein
MPTYEHLCNTCQHEWEDNYSIKLDPPKICPKCQAETVTRLISLGSRGVVELTGHELVAKTKEDIVKLKKEMHSSEKVYSNMLGHDKYEAMQQRIDKSKKNRGNY